MDLILVWYYLHVIDNVWTILLQWFVNVTLQLYVVPRYQLAMPEHAYEAYATAYDSDSDKKWYKHNTRLKKWL